MPNSTVSKKSGWPAFLSDLKRRLIQPWKNPKFVFYFFVNVVGIAGIGLWITWVRYGLSPPGTTPPSAEQGLFEAAATYAIAISAVALADVILSKDPLDSFVMFSWGLTVLVGISVAVAFGMPVPIPVKRVVPICVGGVLISLVQWWMINTDNTALQEVDDPVSATGGNPLTPLPGDVSGYKT